MKFETLNVVTLTRKEFEGIFNKDPLFLFFVEDEAVGVDGRLVKSISVYKGEVFIAGATGQGVAYKWEGTKLRMGIIPAGGGDTVWGEAVDLQGVAGKTPVITEEGDWGNIGAGSVSGYARYSIVMDPASLVLLPTGEVTGASEVEVSFYGLNLIGQRVTLDSDDLKDKKLVAKYTVLTITKKNPDTGSDDPFTPDTSEPWPTETREYALGAGKVSIPAQLTIQGKFSNDLLLRLVSTDGTKEYASDYVPYIRNGNDGVPGNIQPAIDIANAATEVAQGAANLAGQANERIDEIDPVIKDLGNKVVSLQEGLQSNSSQVGGLNSQVAELKQESAQAYAKAKAVKSMILTSDLSTLDLTQGGAEKVFETGTCYTEESLGEIPDDVELVRIKIANTGSYTSFCLGLMMEVQDRWMYYLLYNTSDNDLDIDFSGYQNRLFHQSPKPKIPAGGYLLIRYYNSTVFNQVFVTFDGPFEKYTQ